MHAGKLPHESGQTWAVTRLMGAGYLGFKRTATAATDALLQDERMDVHLDGRQFDDLVGVVRGKRDKLVIAAGTGVGLDEMDLSWAEQLGALALVPLSPAAFARRWTPMALGFVAGRIG